MKKILTLLSPVLFCFTALSAEEITPQDSSQASCSVDYLQGYLSAKLEEHFPFSPVAVAMKDGQAIVYIYPDDVATCADIEQFLLSQGGVSSVHFDATYSSKSCEKTIEAFEVLQEGDWLPELSEFFPTMLADPRILGYSAGYRTYDSIFQTALIPVSMGGRFTFYRSGYWHLGMEAGLWAVFEAKTKSLSLLNADYYIGIPLTYIHGDFTARLRIYHQSSHLGDELLVEREDIKRLNPSMEAIDLYLAYQCNPALTIFGGIGRVMRSDDSYKLQPHYVAYGFNYFFINYRHRFRSIDATPYFGLYCTNWEDNDWKFDVNAALGYQWDKRYGHKMRISLKAHDGFAAEGQFSKHRNRYLALELAYGY